MKKRWLLVSMLFTAGMINYLDRAALGIAAPLVAEDLQLSSSELGLIFSSFFFGYAIFCFIGGWASDKIGGTRVIAFAMAAWSLFCAMTSLAVGFYSLLILRVMFGAGEGPLVSSINKVVNNWFPHREAATALGISFCGTPLGGALAGPVVGFAMLQFGWKAAFVVIALFGLIWLVFWLRIAAETPGQDKNISESERREIEEGRPKIAEDAGSKLADYIRRPGVLATAFAYFSYNYILFFFLTWFPSYLAKEHHLTLASMSIATTLPWIMGFVGQALSGITSDFVLKRTGRPVFARKLVLGVCLSLSGLCVALAGLAGSAIAGVALMTVAILFLYLTGSCYWAILQDTVRGENIGGVGGFVHAIANCAGIVGPALTGFMIDATGTFTSSFLLAAAIALLGVLVVLIFVRSEPNPNLPAM